MNNNCVTFEKGLELLAGCKKLKLEAATWLIRIDEDTLGIKLQNTVIIYIFRSGIYQYDSGGWKDRLTLERLSKYGPRVVYTDGNVHPNWLIGEFLFYDGVRMDHTGDILNPRTVKDNSKKRRLQRMVREYIAGYKQHVLEHGVIARSSGDCWSCYLGVNFTDELKEPLGVAHLIAHMKEKQYDPSLLWKAIVTSNYNVPHHEWLLDAITAEVASGKVDLVDRILTSYFYSRKHLLLELIED